MSFSQTPPPSTRLPTPRAVITNLINSLTSAPLLLPSSTTTTAGGAGDAPNPLKSLPQSHRPLLVTLHVLFPSLVLPALDLLDRNLVTRVVPESASPGNGGREGNDPADPAPAPANHHHSPEHAHHADADGQGSSPPFPSQTPPHLNKAPRTSPAAFHLVRSVASTMTRRSHAVATSASASTTYLVRLDAWNCTCANFAFDAFPAGAGAGAGGTATARQDLEDEIMDADAAEDSDGECEVGDWQFGGLSLDGMNSGGVPCCKHLLACLLSEQWGDALGKYVTERIVSREEMAGLVAEV
ncbi:ubiquitin carboxyl-terminal hydrolase family protein [Colletotrichum tofieldiae]|uniref:Ubiquitin carboxyl-terminal hydrolase family protein n=1 Tax=Colletotrichum tofieldiae TaxID=708197 RepID=A0A161WAZ8_9PEZI|nr:ubiquitin carboxyl-terminal hydrolase family protein [Colletotrichum tofieldiae]GKT57410.1 ubiquitin carboxyl-terminal hydrolase family protein [Colletotrichum tofieldiae]GKT76981.1 ubiquitin carboxyl-terminal hydrolase family protein [Colletotrichum tofieldiae]